MNNTKQIIDNHNERIQPSTLMKPPITVLTGNDANADKRSHAHLTETALSYQLHIKPLSRLMATALLKHTLDSQKTTSRHVTETTLHHFATLNTRTLPNSANTSGLLKTTTLTTLFHGASFHLAHLTTAQANDVIYVSKRNFLSSVVLIHHHLTNVTNLYLLAAKETKRCCETNTFNRLNSVLYYNIMQRF